MSHKYPCIYYDNGKCQKFSDEKYNSWCDFDQCEFQTPSNGDRIRSMSDEELAKNFVSLCSMCECCSKLESCDEVEGYECCMEGVKNWLSQPAKEDT